MSGLELETDGGEQSAGAHWEKRILGNEFMVADADIEDVVYSDITFALFEDSGWYQVDYTYTMPIIWGRNAGCEWFTLKCIDSSIQAP
jgi:hypothetical protein